LKSHLAFAIAAAIGIAVTSAFAGDDFSFVPVQAQVSWLQQLSGNNQRGVAPTYPGVSRGRNFAPLNVKLNIAGASRAGMIVKFTASSPTLGAGCFILDQAASCCTMYVPYGRSTVQVLTNAQGEASVPGVRVWGPGTRGSAGCQVTVTAENPQVRGTTFNLIVD
jgi:hypothetical protein